MTAVDIMRDNPSLHYLSVSTVRLAIRKTLGFFYRRAAKKPPLTPRMLEDRLRFCDRYEGWSEQHWGQVLFTDVLARRVVTSELLFGEEVVLIDTLSSSSTRHSESVKQSQCGQASVLSLLQSLWFLTRMR